MILDLHYSIYWFVFGIVAICLEVLAPGISMLGVGLSSLSCGFIAYVANISLEWQLLIFSILSIVLTIVSRKWVAFSSRSDTPTLNEPKKQLIGQEFTTDHPIVKGAARMKVLGSYWTVRGENLPAGSFVKVVKITDSHTLWVELLK